MTWTFDTLRNQRLETQDFVRGAVDNVIKFGSNSAVGTSEEDVWDGGGLYNWITTPAQLNVSSSSTEDADGGTGTQQIIIEGLDENWLPISETITLTGQTPVTTTSSVWYRVNRAYAVGTVGSSGSNAGDVYIYTGAQASGVPSDLTKVYAKILAGNGQTLMAVYSVGTTYDEGYSSGHISVGKGNTEVSGYMKFRIDNGPWRVVRSVDLYRNNFHEDIKSVTVFPEKTDIRVSAIAGSGTAGVSATMAFHRWTK